MPIDKGTSKPITQLSSLQINYKDENSCFNLPIVTTAERDALVNTDDPAKPIKDGTMVYNSEATSGQVYQNGEWVNVGGGDPAANVVTSEDNGQKDYLVAYAGNDRTVKDSGVKISEVKKAQTQKNDVNATPLYQLSNLGALQFGSNDNVADTGVILVDGLTPVTFQTQGTGADSRVCTVINGELGEGSSSPSALLEINSTEGAFLPSRLTTAQRDALTDPQNGYICYNTDTKKLNTRENGVWVEYFTGSNKGKLPFKELTDSWDYTPSLVDDCIISVVQYNPPSETRITLPEYENKDLGKIFIISDSTTGVGADKAHIVVIGKINGIATRYTISSKCGFVVLCASVGGWVIIGQSRYNSKRCLIYNKDNPPPKNINLISDLFPNTDSLKLTMISSGGKGGKGVGTINGAGGGGGAVLVAYLNNIHSTNAKYIWIATDNSNLENYETYVIMNKSDVLQTSSTVFRCIGIRANVDGSDGNSSVNIGGLGVYPEVIADNDYPQSNFTWYGFKGTNGQGCSPNTSYSGSGGSSAVGQGAYGVGFNSNGIDSIIGYGGGGSGGNGDGKLGGSGGDYGTIIFEWEE